MLKSLKLFLLVGFIAQSQLLLSQNHYPSSGNVGIGTLSPGYTLDVNGTWAVRSTGYFYNSVAYAYESSTNSYFGLATQGGVGKLWMESAKPMVLQPAGGNVGIGMSAPQDRLHVADGNIRIGTDAGDYGQIYYSGGGMGIYNQWISDNAFLRLGAGNDLNAMIIMGNGNIGIGTASPCADCKLDVNGKIRSEEVKVAIVNAPDYVFEATYDLPKLKETKQYIEQHKHLPEIPAGKDMEANGVDLGVMNMMLLKKIEEMTLHQIELMERLEEVESSNEEMSKQINALQEARN